MRSRNFNPRSREGSDCRSGVDAQERQHFNPRSREGSDDTDGAWHCGGPLISIHAPAKGATCAPFMPLRRGKDFNPRSREGSDLCSRTRSNALTNFNPRSREGSDTRHLSRMRHAEHFNPRSREGSDVVSIAQEQTPYLFQSTLPRRERPEKIKSVTFPKGISIHAPAKGATVKARTHCDRWQYFNPRSREGSDGHDHLCGHLVTTFQSTLPRRERRVVDGVRP